MDTAKQVLHLIQKQSPKNLFCEVVYDCTLNYMYWFNETVGKNHLKDTLKNTWYLGFYFGPPDEGRHPESKYS